MRMDWHGDAAGKAIGSRLGSRVALALTHPLQRMQSAIATQGPPRSRPGDPPHKDTGALLAGLFVDADPGTMSGRIGSDVEQSIYTEVGTARMAPRPWFLASILDTAGAMARELGS